MPYVCDGVEKTVCVVKPITLQQPTCSHTIALNRKSSPAPSRQKRRDSDELVAGLQGFSSFDILLAQREFRTPSHKRVLCGNAQKA